MKEFPGGDHGCVLRRGAGVYISQNSSDYNLRCVQVTVCKFYCMKL